MLRSAPIWGQFAPRCNLVGVTRCEPKICAERRLRRRAQQTGPKSAQNAAKCADLRSQQCVDLGRLGSAPFFTEDVLLTADAAFLRRKAASAVKEDAARGPRRPRVAHLLEKPPRRESRPKDPPHARTQRIGPKSVQNAANWPQIEAGRSDLTPHRNQRRAQRIGPKSVQKAAN